MRNQVKMKLVKTSRFRDCWTRRVRTEERRDEIDEWMLWTQLVVALLTFVCCL